MRPRFTIAALLALVAASGIAFAALRHADEVIASLVFTAAILASGVTALGAAFSRGRRRAFFTGFAAFGFGYLALCYGPFAATAIRPHLVTEKLLANSAEHLHRGVPVVPTITQLATDHDRDGVTDSIWIDFGSPIRRVVDGSLVKPLTLMQVGRSEPFERVGHSLFALLLALFGGLAARHFAARTERDANPTPPAVG
ncbi:hypothetical protein [Tautonia plasticadhaerens]|uniref:Uncharacterized protein n=1 Tax=Tautonia plasticadhaerens TaxID=2527974 RepID=A0A518HEQ3_9BACT|nr:hypothetical protein [Tautonia plasticadhaerens]QDV39302.1 hypothetical protein ElP_72660 [Tautonia plasticadhaerens]